MGWWDELCELSKVLGGCCEVELVTGTAWASQSKPTETEDAFEVSKEHLDFLSQLARDGILRGLCDGASDIPRRFMD